MTTTLLEEEEEEEEGEGDGGNENHEECERGEKPSEEDNKGGEDARKLIQRQVDHEMEDRRVLDAFRVTHDPLASDDDEDNADT